MHTAQPCTVNIQANGPITATSGNVRIELQRPFSASNYTKGRYTPIAGTSSAGYMLIWMSGQHNVTSSSIIDRTVKFDFNSGMNNRLQIEVMDRQAGTEVSCEIPV